MNFLLPAVRHLLILMLPFSFSIRVGAGEGTGGKWTPLSRADSAMKFFTRMCDELRDRTRRLQEAKATAPELKLTFIDSASSPEEKPAAEWAKFMKGDMGEGGTTRWIDKGLKELEAARKKLAAAEKPARSAWDKQNPEGRSKVDLPPETTEFIYDIEVQARNLGVILDNSPSMTRHLPAVREEIGRRFKGARYVEVDGCEIKPHRADGWAPKPLWFYSSPHEERNPFDPKWFLDSIPSKEIHYHMIVWERDALAALEALIINMEVDAIYWFCDFDDPIDGVVLQRFSKLVEDQKVRMYVHSLKASPPGALENLVRRSGGKLTKADPSSSGKPAGSSPDAPPAAAPAAAQFDDRYKDIGSTQAEIIAHENKDVRMHLEFSKAILLDGGHVKLTFKGTSLFAGCRVDDIGTVFGKEDPFALPAGTPVTIQAPLRKVQTGYALILKGGNQFLPNTLPPAARQ